MYAAYFGLKQEPFSIAPDPRLLFMSERHREALAHLLYGVQGGGGFVLLTGEIGTGKTTVCRSFLEQVPAHCKLAYIFNPKLTVLELLETVCHEFGLAVTPPSHRAATVKDWVDALNDFLLKSHAAGRNNVLVIDEAQNLAPEVLEQLRLLTNLETSERKLLQIILIGQPELREMLARPDLEQLAQRVIARYHLQALHADETAQYVRHRLEVCGLERPLPFDRAALKRVHALTGGVPRRINLLCDRALLGAYANGQGLVTRRIVNEAALEVFPRAPRWSGAWPRTALAAVVGLAAGAGLLAAATHRADPGEPLRLSLSVSRQLARAAPAASPSRNAEAPALLRSEREAWRELALAWKLPVTGDEPCTALAREQVQCFTRQLSLATIRQLGRPGIVTLDAQGGQPAYAILTAVSDQSATLRAAGTEQTVTLAALAQRWNGEFSTLWRVPAGGATLDPGTRAQLRAFQLAQGLPADGKPGPLTYMQLNRARGVDEPRLRTGP
jgi:general secretion pathway protein A